MISSLQAVEPPCLLELSSALNPSLKYDQAVSAVKEGVWDQLANYTVGEALEQWLETLSRLTAINYRSGMRKLIELECISLEASLQAFALVNHEAIVDCIKAIVEWSECTRQSRAACYISFTGFLSRRFQGLIKKAVTSKEGVSKTFYRVHEKVKSRAMTQAQWVAFFGAMQNARDCLIAKTALQGGKRINEVLSLTTEQIDWDRNEITFVQSKTKGMHKETVITYPKHFMEALKAYIGDRQGLVFMTRTGKTVLLRQVANSFEKAGIKANIPFKGGLKPNGTRTYAKEIYPLHVVSIAWKGDFNKRHKVSSEIAVFIPLPHRHRRHYHGVFAPNSPLRKIVVAHAKQCIGQSIAPCIQKAVSKAKRISLDWAQLIKRIYEVNPLICAGCGQTIKIIGFVTHQAEINRILRGIGWPIKSHEFDPPYEIPNRDICQLIQWTEDGFAPMEVQTHCDIGPDPPFQESNNDPPHWEKNRDPPHCDDHIDPPHWED